MRALIIASLLCASAAWADDAPAAAPDGQEIYSHKCSGCHGPDGKADTKQGHKYNIANFTEPKWSKEWNRAQVKKTVESGVQGKMPSFKEKLSADEIDAVAGYVFKLAGKPNHK